MSLDMFLRRGEDSAVKFAENSDIVLRLINQDLPGGGVQDNLRARFAHGLFCGCTKDRPWAKMWSGNVHGTPGEFAGVEVIGGSNGIVEALSFRIDIGEQRIGRFILRRQRKTRTT